MDPLLDIIRAVAVAEGLPQIAQSIRDGARHLVGADGVSFVLHDDGQCHYFEEDAIAPLWKGRRFPMSICISGWVMQHAQIALIRDIFTDARIPHDVYRQTFVKSLAMVPAPQDKPVAALGAYWATAHEASWSEQHTLQALANAVGLAMKNMTHLQALRAPAAVEER
jgi:GAF domain-containing protein